MRIDTERHCLYLLVLDSVRALEPDIFCRAKISDDQNHNPAIGFISEELGLQLVEAKKLDGFGSIKKEGALTINQVARLKKLEILFFETPENVRDYVEQVSSFNFIEHVFTYAAVKTKLVTFG
ncbi:MAG TPA: hypothetical protein VIF60_07780 [Burkholderiaceae bacterium]|jgi:hypothetical protein